MPNLGSQDWLKAVERALGGRSALATIFAAAEGAGKAIAVPDTAVPGTGGNGNTWEDVPGGHDLVHVPAFTVFIPAFYLEVFLPGDPANESIALNSNFQIVAIPSSGEWTTLPGMSGATPYQVASSQPSGPNPREWTPVIVNSPSLVFLGQDVDLSLQATLYDANHEAVAGTNIRNVNVDVLL